MTIEEQENFLNLVKQNSSFVEQVRKNMIIDLLLLEKFSAREYPLNESDQSLSDTQESVDAYLARVTAESDPDVNTTIIWPDPVKMDSHNCYLPKGTISKHRLFGIPRRIILTLAVSVLLVACVFLLYYYGEQAIWFDTKMKTLARVEQAIDVNWADSGTSYKPGKELGPGLINLTSGLLKLKFPNEAEVILNGPVEFVLSNDSSCLCTKGSLSAYVPPAASGFEIKTPFARVIDRGTEFSLLVDQKGTRLDVIKGKVDMLWSQKLSSLSVNGGEGSYVTQDVVPKKEMADVSRYVSPKEYIRRLDIYSQGLEKQRDRENAMMDKDPHLVARYDFTQKNRTVYSNQAAGPSAVRADAIPSGTSLGEGRYPGWKAISMNSKHDHVQLKIPGKMNDMTLRLVFRLEEIPAAGVVLIASDDCLTRAGAFVLQIIRGGRLHLRVRLADQDKYANYFSEPIFTKSNCRTWFNIVVTADQSSKTTTFYADGKKVTSVPWKEPVFFDFGQGIIGNSALQNTKTERSFRGSVEEFAIYDTSNPASNNNE